MVGHTELAGSVLGSVLGAFLLKPVGYNKTQSGCFRLDEAYFALQTSVMDEADPAISIPPSR